ncbi:MAG: hypothetical protein LBC86_09410 [Oscillospiraceae bacterium]|jgi:hypothetical protein|nr:hypothetical protein [Oscillospiraceae bacterium]
MKKKILSAVLAMVICFSAFSFVVIADEVPAGAKSRDELQDLVGGFSAAWLDNDLWEYGSHGAGLFDIAIELARVTLADGDAEATDITAAYVILEAAFDNLVKKTAAELGTLRAEVRPTYSRGNVVNAADDPIFSDDSWAAFEEAYDAADWLAADAESNDITDAYLALEASFDGLDRMQVVSRNDINALTRAVTRLDDTRDKFTPERRGSAMTGWGRSNVTNWGALWDGNPSFENDWNPDGDWAGNYDTVSEAWEEAAEIFGEKGVSSTTDASVVDAYNDAKSTTDLIASFTGDGTGRAQPRAITGLMNDNHEMIVRHDNARLATDTSLAMVTRVTAGDIGGALTALYAHLEDEIDGLEWIDRAGTNIPANESRFSIPSTASGATGRYDPDGESAINFGANVAADLVSRVPIDALEANVAWRVGLADLNALHAGLGNAWANAQRALNGDDLVGFPDDHPDFGVVLAHRMLKYAIDDAGLGDPRVTRARLEALIEASFAIDEITVPFFAPRFRGNDNGFVPNGDGVMAVVPARAAANAELRRGVNAATAANRPNLTNQIDQRNFASFYDDLDDAINNFYDGYNVVWPVAMNEGELSVFEVIMISMDSDSEEVAKLRSALAIAILENAAFDINNAHGNGWTPSNCPGWFTGICSGCPFEEQLFNGPIFNENGGIDATARLYGGPAWGGTGWPAFEAYKVLADALGLSDTAYMKGDVNGDGEITTADALEILRYVAGLESAIDDNPRALVAASITSDTPTTACALAILRHVAGLEAIS